MNLVYTLKSEVRKNVGRSVKVYGDFAGFFVSFHCRFVISKPDFSWIRDNLPKGERSALRTLKNSDVTIRIQDKGSRFVLINPTGLREASTGKD